MEVVASLPTRDIPRAMACQSTHRPGEWRALRHRLAQNVAQNVRPSTPAVVPALAFDNARVVHLASDDRADSALGKGL